MALQPVHLPADLKKKLLRHIRTIVAKGIIPHQATNNAIEPAYWMYSQMVPRKDVSALALGRPEGIRVILFQNGQLLSLLDFFFNRKRLFFSACVQGPNLLLIVEGLNKIEKIYRTVKQKQEVQFVHFLFNPFPYLMLKDGKKRKYFHFPNGKFREITKEKLRQQVLEILKSTSSHA